MPTPAADTRTACTDAVNGLHQGENGPMATWLRRHLHEHVMDFWMQYGLDAAGGLNTCLADDGRILSDDKWLWSQWRAVWVFSRLYRRHGRDPRWLSSARLIVDFCVRHGWDAEADGWALVLSPDGRMRRGSESIYTDGFAVSGLTEFHRASGDAAALAVARKTADAALKKLAGPIAAIPHFPYPIPIGGKPHGLPMFWSFILAESADLPGLGDYRAPAAAFADEVFRDFHRKYRDVMLEFVQTDGRELPPPQGTAVVPGHAVESMWFQIHVALRLGGPSDRIDEACRLILRHLDLGWDHAHGGGLLLAVDADGRKPVGWNFADSKLWWPQTEALYAVLLAWMHTRRPVFLNWYAKLWDLCLRHYVDWQHGEWRQKLDRSFQPMADTVALPVKDPFHLPRSLILQIELLESADPASASPGLSFL